MRCAVCGSEVERGQRMRVQVYTEVPKRVESHMGETRVEYRTRSRSATLCRKCGTRIAIVAGVA